MKRLKFEKILFSLDLDHASFALGAQMITRGPPLQQNPDYIDFLFRRKLFMLAAELLVDRT